MPNVNTDANGIEFKNIELEQYDNYDGDAMYKMQSRYDKRIGSLLIMFGEVEHALDDAIAFIINDRTDDWGVRIVMDMRYMQKVELYNRLCKFYLVASDKRRQLNKLADFINRLRSAGQIRNLVAHAKWMSLDEEGYVRSKANLNDDAEIQFKYYKLTPQVLYNLERRMQKTMNDFYNFRSDNELA